MILGHSPSKLVRILWQQFVDFFWPDKFHSHLHGGKFFTHSVRSPLTTLNICLSELMQQETMQKSTENKKFLESALVATKQIDALIEVATARNPYDKVHEINLANFFKQLQALLELRDSSQKLSFSINLISGKESIRMNRYFFFELMQCLINNAFESYKKHEPLQLVNVVVLIKQNRVEILVQDFGCGLDFFSTQIMTKKNFSTKGEQRGFGLWFAKEVVESYGDGKLKIHSMIDEGTTIKFSLPLSPTDNHSP